jgi:hypothetical protein
VRRAFLIYGASICAFFAYASYRGWSVTWADVFRAGKWGPRGHSAYHK